MARYRRSNTARRGRTTSRYARRTTPRRSYAPRRARAATRGYRNGAQTVRLVIESGPSSLVQRPDGMMAAVTQPSDGKAKF